MRRLAVVALLAICHISWTVSKRIDHGAAISPADLHLERDILLVTAFFPIRGSKHSDGRYRSWMKNFLSTVETPVYFFTMNSRVPEILRLRGPLPIIFNTSYASPFDIPPLRGLSEVYQAQAKIDPENRGFWGDRHPAELYAVWNAKPYFLHEGLLNANSMSAYDEKFSYAFWIDVGSFREPHSFRTWPGRERLDSIFDNGQKNAAPTPRLFIPFYAALPPSLSKWTTSDGPFEVPNSPSFSIGSFFGGDQLSIAWYRQEFYRQHGNYVHSSLQGQHRYFVGKDQPLINALMLRFPQRFVTSSFSMASRGQSERQICGDPWYYFLFMLARDSERTEMANMWWNASWWWQRSDKTRCQLETFVSPLEDLLIRWFGAEFQPAVWD